MIDIKELRFGNYVRLTDPNDKTENMVVGGIMPDKISLWLPNKVSSGDREILNGVVIPDWQHEDGFEINPIPITEKILEKCGFKIDDKQAILKINDWIYIEAVIHSETEVGIAMMDIKEFATGFHPTRSIQYLPILYLHQLQNLYFALTGEEIEVEL